MFAKEALKQQDVSLLKTARNKIAQWTKQKKTNVQTTFEQL